MMPMYPFFNPYYHRYSTYDNGPHFNPKPYFPNNCNIKNNNINYQDINKSNFNSNNKNCDSQNKNNNSENTKDDDSRSYSAYDNFFEIFGIKLYFDDLLILALLFFLYKEEVEDSYLYIALILLLLS